MQNTNKITNILNTYTMHQVMPDIPVLQAKYKRIVEVVIQTFSKHPRTKIGVYRTILRYIGILVWGIHFKVHDRVLESFLTCNNGVEGELLLLLS